VELTPLISPSAVHPLHYCIPAGPRSYSIRPSRGDSVRSAPKASLYPHASCRSTIQSNPIEPDDKRPKSKQRWDRSKSLCRTESLRSLRRPMRHHSPHTWYFCISPASANPTWASSFQRCARFLPYRFLFQRKAPVCLPTKQTKRAPNNAFRVNESESGSPNSLRQPSINVAIAAPYLWQPNNTNPKSNKRTPSPRVLNLSVRFSRIVLSQRQQPT